MRAEFPISRAYTCSLYLSPASLNSIFCNTHEPFSGRRVTHVRRCRNTTHYDDRNIDSTGYQYRLRKKEKEKKKKVSMIISQLN